MKQFKVMVRFKNHLTSYIQTSTQWLS
uniref:Uncharacterized protein n=1 Tax=Arundo donax TaxID=35708 RepID=A0A0A9BTG5_ARUDO